MTRRARGSAVAVILTGSAGAQLIALCALPLLTRLYTPTDFGVYSAIIALAAVFGTVAAGRFDLAVPIPARAEDSYAVVGLGFASSALVATLGTAAIALAWIVQPTLLHSPTAQWLWAVPWLAGLYGAFLTLNQLAIRMQRFGRIAARNLLQGSTMVATQSALGVPALISGGLIWGYAAGQFVGTASLLPKAGLGVARKNGWFATERLRVQFFRFRQFPTTLTLAGLLNSSGIYLPVILIGYLFGPHAAGLFAVAQRLLAAPITLIGTSVSQVFIAQAAEANRSASGDLRRVFSRYSVRLALVAVPMVVSVVVLAPHVLPLVLGNQYRGAALMVAMLACATGAQLVAAPLSQVLVLLEYTGWQLAWDSLRVFGIGLAIFACSYAGTSVMTAVAVVGATSTLLYATLWFACRVALERSAGES